MAIMCNVDYLSFIIIVEVITIGTISKEALRGFLVVADTIPSTSL